MNTQIMDPQYIYFHYLIGLIVGILTIYANKNKIFPHYRIKFEFYNIVSRWFHCITAMTFNSFEEMESNAQILSYKNEIKTFIEKYPKGKIKIQKQCVDFETYWNTLEFYHFSYVLIIILKNKGMIISPEYYNYICEKNRKQLYDYYEYLVLQAKIK